MPREGTEPQTPPHSKPSSQILGVKKGKPRAPKKRGFAQAFTQSLEVARLALHNRQGRKMEALTF